MKTKRPSWFPLHFSSVCLLGALALGSCRPLFQRELRVPVLSLEGSAQGTQQGNSVAVTKNSWVHPGEKITTATGARLALLLVPGVMRR